MTKRTINLTLPAVAETSSIYPVLDLSCGSLKGGDKQIYDNSDGSYLPDRKTTPLVLQPKVRIENPNVLTSDGKATIADAKITSVSWYYSDGETDSDGNVVKHEIANVANKTVITANTATNTFTLKYYINIPAELGGRKIYAKVNYVDPNIKESQTVTLDTTLTTAVSASISLSLQDDPDTAAQSKLYVCDGYELNPVTDPRVDDDGNDINNAWKRYLRCQLYNGTSEVKDAHSDSDGYESDRTGNAFYFWYQVINGTEHLLTKDVEWFDGTFFADGTASKECCVDLGKIQTVHLRCYAGYIPYGELDDFIDGSGMIVPSKCKYGYLRHDYRLNVRIQPIDSFRAIDITSPIVYKKETDREDIKVVKRALINSYGMTLNDMSLTRQPEKYTLVEKLFNITWELAAATDSSGNATEWTVVSNREFLETTTKALGWTRDHDPSIRLTVEPRYPSLYGNNYVVGYNDNSLDVIPIEKHGNNEWLSQYNFVLCDMTETYSKTVEGTSYLAQKSIMLRRDNLLRNAGGDFAPVVVISDEQYADSLLALYTKSGSSYVAYCNEGGYDPVAYLESMLRPFYEGSKTQDAIKLYKKNDDGTYSEAHALLPWETTDNRWSIFLDAFGRDVYFLDNVVGESGTCWRGIFSDLSNVEGGKWDGIDISQYRLRRAGISPSPVTTISYDGKTVTRNMFYLKSGMTSCQGASGTSGCTDMLQEPGRTYPRTGDIAAVENMKYARNNNPTATNPYPVAEGGFNNMSALVMAQELLHGTKSLYTPSMYGSGISSNDACTTEEQYLLSGGTRMRKSSSDAWTYKAWNSTAPFKPSSTATAGTMTATLNQEAPKEQCMESLIVLSFAKEFGIAPDTWFTVYGDTYKYSTPSGCKGLADGYMNARVYKDVGGTANGYNTSTSEAETWTVEAMLRMSICGGFNLCGDINAYWQGGSEIIHTTLVDWDTSRAGNDAISYSELDQLKWIWDENISLPLATQFKCQTAYAERYHEESTFNGWLRKRASYSPLGTNGGSSTRGECCYQYLQNYISNDKTVHVRAALRFRLSAYYPYCAPRSLFAYYSAAAKLRYFGGSAQVLL